jgi:hypothetical protein
MLPKLPVVFTVAALMSITTCRTTLGQKRPKSDTGSIHVSELNRGKVIGSLGYALGEVIIVEGVIADENYTKRKADVGKSLLRVRAVNGKPLKEEVIFDFSPFSGADIRNPEVGARFKYTGYETGGFSGLPEQAFDYVPRVPTAGYYFSTSFVILRDESGRK